MTDLAAWLHGRTRGLGLAALVGAAMLLAPAGFLPAAAAKAENAEFVRGPGGTGSDAEGRIRFKRQPRGERLKIRLENLLPRTDYEIRDGASGDVLGTVRTDRRGRARKTLKSEAVGSLSGASLEICEPGSDDPVLEGRVPGGDGGMPWNGGSYLVGTVSTDPEAAVQVSITLSSTPAYSPDGSEVKEGTYDSISLFASPGGVWMMEDGSDRGNDGGDDRFPTIPGPVTFWIADGERGLVKVATIEGGDGYAGDPGMNGTVDGMIYPQPGFFSWYADNASEEGLPLGVASVGDLSGRRFEVRDGEDTVLLDGVLPRLEEVVFEPGPDPKPEPDPVPCPWGGIDIDITIVIDFSGIDWSTFDFSKFDWGSLDLGTLLGNDGTCFDFSGFLREFKL